MTQQPMPAVPILKQKMVQYKSKGKPIQTWEVRTAHDLSSRKKLKW